MKLLCPHLRNASQRRFLPIFNTYCDSKSALPALGDVTRAVYHNRFKTLLAVAGAFFAKQVVFIFVHILFLDKLVFDDVLVLLLNRVGSHSELFKQKQSLRFFAGFLHIQVAADESRIAAVRRRLGVILHS